jgi:hypothetical protein
MARLTALSTSISVSDVESIPPAIPGKFVRRTPVA